MKLHHTVNHIPQGEIARSIEANGLKPQIASVYADLVPKEIRHLPVVWLAEGVWQSYELPVFEVDSKNLDKDKLYPTAIMYEVDKTLHWWVYQGAIPPKAIKRLEPLIKEE